jgi:hypothetical protein
LGEGGIPRQLPLRGDEEIQVPEMHVCARDLADIVASHPWPDVDDETCKRPLPGVPTVGVSKPPTSKFMSARLALMVRAEDTRNYTGSRKMSLRPVRCCSCYRLCICSRGYKQASGGGCPKSP